MAFCKNASQDNAGKTRHELAKRIVELEKTLYRIGACDKNEKIDSEEVMAKHLLNEPRKVARWLENKCLDYFDEIRLIQAENADKSSHEYAIIWLNNLSDEDIAMFHDIATEVSEQMSDIPEEHVEATDSSGKCYDTVFEYKGKEYFNYISFYDQTHKHLSWEDTIAYYILKRIKEGRAA